MAIAKLFALNANVKKRPWHRCFPVNFARFLRTPFSAEPLLKTASDAYVT